MPFEMYEYERIRPFLYHLTARANLPRIRRVREIESAEALMIKGGTAAALGTKRAKGQQIEIAGLGVHIRDQSPLHEGNISFEGGWTFVDLIRDLNKRVFFWPGTSVRPISYGERHYERYRDEEPVIIRVPFSGLCDLNRDSHPFFCKFNSGSPRCSGGRGSPRGPRTFVRASETAFRPSNVVEVTFLSAVQLPAVAEFGDSPTGPWQRLFGD